MVKIYFKSFIQQVPTTEKENLNNTPYQTVFIKKLLKLEQFKVFSGAHSLPFFKHINTMIPLS